MRSQGMISAPVKMTGEIKQVGTLKGSIEMPSVVMPYRLYEGEYEVIPEVESQTMSTANTIMREDVIIQAIPYFEVSNLKGKTVYIGGE